MTRYAPFTLALGVVAATAGPAAAGGFSVARFGSEHGHPATDHPTAIYYNPAGLARTAGTRLYVEGLIANRRAVYERPPEAVDNALAEDESGTGTPADALSANAGRAEVSDLLRSPFVGIATGFGEDSNFGLGLALYAPFGGSSSWSRNSEYAGNQVYPGAFDGVQRWHVIEGSLTGLYVTLGGAYHIEAANLTLGAGFNLIRNDISTIRARTAVGTDDMVRGDGAVFEGRSLLEVSNTTFGAAGGIMWDPIDQLTVGVSYQSVPGFGEMELEGRVVNQFGAGDRSEADVVLVQTLPDIYRAGAAYRIPELDAEIRVSGDYQKWSRFENQCVLTDDPDAHCAFTETGAVDESAGGSGVLLNIPRHYEDTFGVRAGGSYWPLPDAEAFLSLAYDANAIPDETLDPSIIDANKYALTLGGRYELPAEGSAVSAGLMWVKYAARDIEPRSEPLQAPSRSPDAAGTYRQSVTLFTLGLEGQF